MADFLIYRGPHWMDDSNAYAAAQVRIENNSNLSISQILEAKDNLSLKYEARYRKGDIIGVYPEGTITEKPSPNNKCVALRITGLNYENVKNYISPLKEDTGISGENGIIQKIKRRRKMQLLWDDLPQNMKDQLRDERFLIVTKAKAIPYIKEHING